MTDEGGGGVMRTAGEGGPAAGGGVAGRAGPGWRTCGRFGGGDFVDCWVKKSCAFGLFLLLLFGLSWLKSKSISLVGGPLSLVDWRGVGRPDLGGPRGE